MMMAATHSARMEQQKPHPTGGGDSTHRSSTSFNLLFGFPITFSPRGVKGGQQGSTS